MKILNSKKGLGNEVIGMIVFIVIFSFLTIIAYLIYSKFIEGLIVAGIWNGQVEITGTKFLGSLALFDNIAVLITVILIIGIGVGAYRLTAPPVFFLVQFIMSAVYGYISYFFNFIFSSLISDPQFTAVTLFFPKMLLICNNLHWVAIFQLERKISILFRRLNTLIKTFRKEKYFLIMVGGGI